MNLINKKDMKTVALSIILVILSLLVILSCNSPSETLPPPTPTIAVVDTVATSPQGNPCLVYGTTIGELFRTYYKVNNIDSMIGITSKQSIDKFGEKKLRKLYQEMNFGYEIRYKTVTENPDGSYTMVYEKSTFATKGRIVMQVFVEGGRAKIFIKSLNKTNPFE